MKKFLLTALAATVAIAPIAATSAQAAQVRHNGHGATYRDNHRGTYNYRDSRDYRNARDHREVRHAPNYRKWQKGQRFDRRYAHNYRQIDYRQYRGRNLYAPPRGYQWVQSGNDAVLVAVASGLIGAVLAGALN